jgi:hypothetical protein
VTARAAALLAALATVLAAAPTGAAATPRRPPAHPTTAVEPATDGHGVVAWPDADDTHVAHVLRDDQPRSAATRVPIPTGCGLGAPSATALAFVCTRPADGLSFGELRLTDLAGAPLRTYDLERFTLARANGEAYYATALGSAVVQLYGGGNHVSFDQWIRLDDGSALDLSRQQDDLATARDLDAPTGRTPLCAPLRRADLRDPYAYNKPYLLEIRRGHARLSRCGSTRRRDLGIAHGRSLVVTRRYVAWMQGGGVAVRRLADGATFRYRSDDNVAIFGGTDRRLWLLLGDRTVVVEP